MMPVGPGDRRAALDFLLGELAVAGHQPSVRRASRRFVEAGCDPARISGGPSGTSSTMSTWPPTSSPWPGASCTPRRTT